MRIRCSLLLRTFYVEELTRQQQYWIVQPLVDAGLGMDQICGLVFRLGFDGIVSGGIPTGVTSPVDGHPVEIQAAWAETIGRLLTLGAGPDDSSVPSGR